jgi:hypothetical protein
MTHKDTGWEPEGRARQYKGDLVEDHAVGATEINTGEVDPDFAEDGDADDE